MVSRKRYEVGLEKLAHAALQIAVMGEELKALQPALQEAALNVKEILAKVEVESQDVAKV